MKKIYILGLFLFALIVLHLVINLDTTEGFNPKCSITNASSKIGKANRCQYSTIESTRLRTINRASKIKEFENIVKKTKAQVFKNRKDILDGLNITKQLQNVANEPVKIRSRALAAGIRGGAAV